MGFIVSRIKDVTCTHVDMFFFFFFNVDMFDHLVLFQTPENILNLKNHLILRGKKGNSLFSEPVQ